MWLHVYNWSGKALRRAAMNASLDAEHHLSHNHRVLCEESPMATPTDADRRAHISVAQSFAQEDDLKRLGVPVSGVSCAACGSAGKVMGGRGSPVAAQGFELLTRGGLKAVLLQCVQCGERLTVEI